MWYYRLKSHLSFQSILTDLYKPKKHIKENDKDTTNRHAAQIYAEMLSQIYYPKFYNNMNNEYQEVLYPFPLYPYFSR